MSFFKYPLIGVVVFFFGGIVFWGGFNWSLELSNTESFCVSCHAMREYLFKEYKTSVHYANRTGVRASCPDCHVPREWAYKVARKVRATNELFHWIKGSINTPESFKAKRFELAQEVWTTMKETDSRECRNCHRIGFMNSKKQTVTARLMHELANKWKMTCIECHQGIAHSLPEEFDRNAIMNDIHKRLEKDKVACKLCHKGMAGPPAGQGWD